MAPNMHANLLLDRAIFSKTIQVLALRVHVKNIKKCQMKLNGYLLGAPSKINGTLNLQDQLIKKMKHIVADYEPSPLSNMENIENTSKPKASLCTRRILLHETINTISALPPSLVQWIEEEKMSILEHNVQLHYDNWSMDYILTTLLPTGTVIPSSYEAAGHVAHLNLKEGCLPYKHLIGQVLIDKNTIIRTVVNKTSSIATEFRTFPMELLAGEDDLQVEVHESKARFKFNYAQVYWNSRLQHEHLRMINLFTKKEIICDMMCGIGPFAIPLAMKGCTVLANDLNPQSFKYLTDNMKLNKIGSNLTAYNLCGRDFIRTCIQNGRTFDHVLMNLPASALEFLDVFSEPSFAAGWTGELPMIHCYCFSSSETPEDDVHSRAETVLGMSISDYTVFHVRNVAPKKEMLCLSFRLPSSAKRLKLQ